MKRKLFFISTLQVVVLIGLHFLLMTLISNDSWQSCLIQSIIFIFVYCFLFPKVYKLFFAIKTIKEYKLSPDEKLLFETKVYMIGLGFPEKINLKISNKNLIYRFYREDKVIALSDLNSVNLKSKDITFHYNCRTKKAKISFITDQGEMILKSIPKIYQFNNKMSF